MSSELPSELKPLEWKCKLAKVPYRPDEDVYNWPGCIRWRFDEFIMNLHDDFGDVGFNNH